MDKERICAVVVTYNRKELLLECINALIKQTKSLDAVYIIDNASTDGTPELLKKEKYIDRLPKYLHNRKEIIESRGNKLPKLIYVRLPDNIGSAGGFHVGIKQAYNDGYDWIWIMDDDAEPKEDALEKMLEEMSEKVAYSNLKVDANGRPQYQHRGFKSPFYEFGIIKKLSEKDLIKKKIEIDHSSFVGIMIPKEIVEKVGLPKKEFFIYSDDLEYCFRIREKSKIVLIRDSIIYHKDAAKKEYVKKVGDDSGNRIPFQSFWRVYYGIRNSLYVRMKYYGIGNALFSALFMFVKGMAKIIFFDDKKLERIKIFTQAIIDGLNENFELDKPKKVYEIIRND